MLTSALAIALCLLLGRFCVVGTLASSDTGHVGALFNVSSNPMGSSAFDINDLFTLAARQGGGRRCSIPGGPLCPVKGCCRPGQHCCSSSCCDLSANCDRPGMCCPKVAQTCGGTTCCEPGGVCCSQSPTGCCAPGGICCSQFAPCCPPGSICEQGECVSEELKNRIVRFKLDEKKNGDLLRNMCNGMRGKNTEVLTYSGPANTRQLRREKRAKRRRAGCNGRFCRKTINNNGTTTLNSCDEYPPASSDEGGDIRPTLQRVVRCIPAEQNTLQGIEFSRMITSSKLQKGDKWVISIDCTKVLRTLIPRDTISTSGSQGSIYHSSFGNDSTGFIIVPFGDLDAGSYSATIQLTSGSSISAVVINNEGDNLTAEYPGINPSQSQQFNFDVEDDEVGVGIVISTMDNSTNLTWTFNGTTSPANSTIDPSSTNSPTNTPPTNSALRVATASLAFLASSAVLVYFSLIYPLL